MAARAVWKGHLEIGELVCAVALHAAASTSERIAFHILNRKTGHRVEREYVDAKTGKPVDREDQAKGYTCATAATTPRSSPTAPALARARQCRCRSPGTSSGPR